METLAGLEEITSAWVCRYNTSGLMHRLGLTPGPRSRPSTISGTPGPPGGRHTGNEECIKPGSVHPSVFGPICADITNDARKANPFAPIPDPQAQTAWAAALTEAGRSGTDCQHALHSDVDGKLFTRSLSEGSKAVNALRVLRSRLDSL